MEDGDRREAPEKFNLAAEKGHPEVHQKPKKFENRRKFKRKASDFGGNQRRKNFEQNGRNSANGTAKSPDDENRRPPNNLKYIILPNSSPPGRFEAHMEVFTGSSDELDKQQGMAHLVEHVAYMGSRKRERLFGTGTQTNAYTDYHHTVFYASCPVLTPPGLGKRKPMLPLALDALCDVLEAKCEPSRLEKERAAVLSEMTMVNTIEYRVECQVLATLHTENMLSRRFPIGKEELIRAWQVPDIKEFHSTHYRPDNAIVYLIGDVDIAQCEEQLLKIFGHIKPSNVQLKPINMKYINQHFPPITHIWSGQNVPESHKMEVMDTHDSKPYGEPRIFCHNLLQAFSFHLFAKKPIEPIKNFGDFRKAVMRRIALAALQIRLSVNHRTDPPFNMVEFNYIDSPREACAVCSLDFTADPLRWREAIVISVREIRRLGTYGLTHGELSRFSSMLLTDSQQLAAQGDRISNSDQLNFLMAAVSGGHLFMDPKQTYKAMHLAVQSLTLKEVKEIAYEMSEHMMSYLKEGCTQPSAILACVPSKESSSSASFEEITVEKINEAILEGTNEVITPPEDTVVPSSLFTKEKLDSKIKKYNPSFKSFVDKENERKNEPEKAQPVHFDPETGIIQRRLSNGIKVNIKKSHHESQCAQMRIVAPGGREIEGHFGKGSIPLGARTMQEGGAVSDLSREQIELFCHDYFVMVAVDTNEEFFWIDLSFPTSKPHLSNTNEGDDELSGIEAGFQIANKILTGYVWEEDAFKRAQQAYFQLYEASLNSLEELSSEKLMAKMSGDDSRFMSVPHDSIRSLNLESVKKAILSQLTTDSIEISLSGDFEVEEAEKLVLQYLGTVPPSTRDAEAIPKNEDIPMTSDNDDRHISVHLNDSDERAVAYVSGLCPNKWGFLRGGESLNEALKRLDPKASKETLELRNHPLFPSMALSLLKEVINRRLFSTVREQLRLTYDANFHFLGFERMQGSWYLITVTANPSKAEAALEACKDTLMKLSTTSPISYDNVENAKRVVLNRHENDERTNQYWCELMGGIQSEAVMVKDISCIRDFSKVLNGVTSKDLQLLLSLMKIDKDGVYTCIGTSGAPVSKL
eukprot:CAMPEP_0171474386 /NCGR_PEP_ID=MMETSP0946-20130122/2397_1 /TAXON_ID=109269 /ORGANISM="Vaucheria litorea, Strain CCMP2940" /LENGTH=1090 /DNA_ID=CAMNT_0012004313 /DNA_START=171 /DNA_END=3444 /DNA_ORIENTATION=+